MEGHFARQTKEVQFFPGGERFATIRYDGLACIIDTPTGSVQALVALPPSFIYYYLPPLQSSRSIAWGIPTVRDLSFANPGWRTSCGSQHRVHHSNLGVNTIGGTMKLTQISPLDMGHPYRNSSFPARRHHHA